jgi:flagellin
MQINHNINAMITQNALRQNNNAMSKSLEKLSTGLRINRAQDDAAGLAMSELMRTQIKGLGKAKQNAQDGIAALQIAEGGLAEITNIMQRQRELAIQAANDTLTSTERKYLDLEFQELTQEIARIAKTTDYNGKNMLNWHEDPNLSFGAVGDKVELQHEIQRELARLNELANRIKASEKGRDAFTGSDLESAIEKLQELADAAKANSDGDDNLADIISLREELAEIVGGRNGNGMDNSVFADLGINEKLMADSIKERLGIIIHNNAEPESDSLLRLYENMVKNDMTKAASYTLHIGSNYQSGVGSKWANQMTVTYISVNPGALGMATKNIKFQYNATEVIDHLDRIIKSVSGARAKIGTYINRLEYTINNIASLEFNTQDAESRIRDTDFAKETTSFTRNQILVQSATSMLAQANTLPQTALSLIQ